MKNHCVILNVQDKTGELSEARVRELVHSLLDVGMADADATIEECEEPGDAADAVNLSLVVDEDWGNPVQAPTFDEEEKA